MEKKIGIITFHLSINYGAVLQCFALQNVISSLGGNVRVIDYHPDFQRRANSIINRNPVLNLLRKYYVQLREYSPKWLPWRLTFNSFIKRRLKLTQRCTYKSIPRDLDVYVVGSDQMWNYKITGDFHPAFFAQFPFPKDGRKYVSYAVSMEAEELSAEQEMKCGRLIQNFDAISVRESVLKNMIQPLTDKPVAHTIDPVLLAERSLWDSFAEVPSKTDKYVLVYQVRYCKEAMDIARDIASQIGASVVELASNMNAPKSPETLGVQSPEQYVGWFKNAECVVTTSYHGLVFSMTFNKPFYMIKIGDGWDSRMVSLIEACHLDGRVISPEDRPTFSVPDYDIANSVLSEMRVDSVNFIKNNIL